MGNENPQFIQLSDIQDDALTQRLSAAKERLNIIGIFGGTYGRMYAMTKILNFGGDAYYLSSGYQLYKLSKSGREWTDTIIPLGD